MKYILFVIILFITGLALAQDHHLNVNIKGFNSDNGKILYTVFCGDEGFPNHVEKAVKRGTVHIKNGKASIDLDLPKNEYAIMVFHDEDDNNELKTNWIGMPKEGVGNSNNHKGMPSYKKSVFTLKEDTSIEINLVYM